jgi:hypothetical protein
MSTEITDATIDKGSPAVDTPILLQIKAAVEKLQGDVDSLMQRSTKACDDSASKSDGSSASKSDSDECKTSTEERVAVPGAKSATKGELTTQIQPQGLKPMATGQNPVGNVPAPGSVPTGTSEPSKEASDVDSDESKSASASSDSSYPAQKAKKPADYPYPDEKMKALEQALANANAKITKLEETNKLSSEGLEVAMKQNETVMKALRLPIKKTTVVAKDAYEGEVDVSKMSWKAVNELASTIPYT